MNNSIEGNGYHNRADTPKYEYYFDKYGSKNKFVKLLEERGFIVQKGTIEYIDVLKLASEGKVDNCFGNNAGVPYATYLLPPAPDQEPCPDQKPPIDFVPCNPDNYPPNVLYAAPGLDYKLRPDEAIVAIGQTPPPAVYFSFRSYLSFTRNRPIKDYSNEVRAGNESTGFYHYIGASLGDQISNNFIWTDSTPYGTPGKPFDSTTILITTADREINLQMRKALIESGFNPGIMNDDNIPVNLVKLFNRVKEDAFCENWLDLYLERAKNLGIEEVGIVDHLYCFRDTWDYYEKHIYLGPDKMGNVQRKWLYDVCVVSSMDQFIEFILFQKERWEKEGVKLKLGIEADFFPNGEEELDMLLAGKPWDFVIGSVHFLKGWGFDNIDLAYIYDELDLMRMYEMHTRYVCQAVESRLFDIAAHLDNLKVFGHRPDEKLLEDHYEQVASALKKHNIATELNTGLFYRAPIEEACPSPNFLETLARYQIPMTMSTDAHYPDDLGKELDMAEEQLRKCGYESLAAFSRRRRYSVPIGCE